MRSTTLFRTHNEQIQKPLFPHLDISQVDSLRALPQPRFPLRRKRSVRSRAGTSVGKTRYFLLRLLWLCRATAKVQPTSYSKKAFQYLFIL